VVFGFSNPAEARDAHMLGHGAREFSAPGAAPCVVAMHGLSGTAAEFGPLLARIATAGFAVDAGLLPGHGTRPTDLQEQRFDGWVEDTRTRTRRAAARYGSYVLLGFSLGSLVAMQLASERDPALAGLIVIGNAVRLERFLSAGLAAFSRLGAFVPDVYVRKVAPGDVVDPSLLDAMATYDRQPLRAAVQVYLAGARVRAVVGRIACPALILHGRRDRVCPWQNAVWLADHIGSKDVTVRVFDRSAHVVACDFDRDEAAEEVSSFLARVRATYLRPVDP
jgi:carboxylesterase